MIIATNSIAEFHRVQTRIIGFLRKRRVWGAPYKFITTYDTGTKLHKIMNSTLFTIGVRAGRGARGAAAPTKFWATQIFWATRENLGKARF